MVAIGSAQLGTGLEQSIPLIVCTRQGALNAPVDQFQQGQSLAIVPFFVCQVRLHTVFGEGSNERANLEFQRSQGWLVKQAAAAATDDTCQAMAPKCNVSGVHLAQIETG